MASLITYEPNSITMPRELVERHINVLATARITKYFSPSYQPSIDDKYALIHDIFRTRDGTKIIAFDSAWWHTSQDKMLLVNCHDLDEYKVGYFEIGRNKMTELSSELSQLLSELCPLKVYHCGQLLKYKYCRLPRTRLAAEIGFYAISLPCDLISKSIIELDFVFGNGKLTRKLQIPRNPFVQLAKTPLVLHTLQKDNPLEWIEDWCKYYYYEHGVKRIVIYDNDSTNRNELEQYLKNIEYPLDLILIKWPFNYNISFNGTQKVALNHTLHLLGDSGHYYLNFDIDEYLVNRNDLSLEQYLCENDGQRAYHRVNQRVVAAATKTNGLARVSDFQYVQKHCLSTAPKTINVQGRVEYIDIHDTVDKLHFASYVFSRVSTALLEQFHLSSRSRRLFDRIIIKMSVTLSSVSLCMRRRYCHTVKHKPLYFNHYRGLNTRWKWKMKYLPIDKLPKDYVLDTVMIKKLKRIGLTSNSTIREQKDAID